MKPSPKDAARIEKLARPIAREVAERLAMSIVQLEKLGERYRCQKIDEKQLRERFDSILSYTSEQTQALLRERLTAIALDKIEKDKGR